jgi:hypothetical protein
MADATGTDPYPDFVGARLWERERHLDKRVVLDWSRLPQNHRLHACFLQV